MQAGWQRVGQVCAERNFELRPLQAADEPAAMAFLIAVNLASSQPILAAIFCLIAFLMARSRASFCDRSDIFVDFSPRYAVRTPILPDMSNRGPDGCWQQGETGGQVGSDGTQVTSGQIGAGVGHAEASADPVSVASVWRKTAAAMERMNETVMIKRDMAISG